jgi:ABC-type multidrug transport system fused ATPase/permease subunit
MADFRENVDKLNVRGIILSAMMTAFGLVVALSWKDAINALVARIIPSGSGSSLLGQFITASAVTLLVVVLATTVLRINRRLERQWERMSEQMSEQIDRVTDLFDRD